MKVRNSRAALLSDYEVLSVMREMDKKLQEGAAAAAAASATSSSQNNQAVTNGTKGGALDQQEEKALKSLPSNLRSIQYKVLETLSSVQRPCAHQDSAKIPAFMNAISAWERGRKVAGLDERRSEAPIEKEKRLTKGERLMLVNHAPTTIVELHTLIEEIEERFTWEEREDILSIVAFALPLDTLAMQREEEQEAAAGNGQGGQEVQRDAIDGEEVYVGQADEEEEEEDAMEQDMDELENEGAGEGAVDDDAKEDGD